MSDEAVKSKPVILYIHETVLQSWLRDAGSVVAAFAIIGIGIWAGSSAMQWAGFIVFFLFLIARVTSHNCRVSIGEARRRLDELENRP